MSYMLGNLLGLLGLSGLFYLTGALIDGRVAAGRGLEPLPAVGRYAAGAAIWMGLIFALAAGGLLRPLFVVAVLLLVVVAAVRERRHPGFRPGPHRPRMTWPDHLESLPILAALGAVLVASWLQTLWPQLSWDADTYHLTVPRLYLEHGGFRRIPFNVYSNWPLNTELLFALAQMARDWVWAKQVHFGFGVASLILVYRVAHSAGARWTGWLAAILLAANPIVLQELRVAYVDLAFAFFFFLAFVYLHHALEQADQENRLLLLSGLFSGVAAGIKPTGFVGVACLAVLFWTVGVRRRKSWRALLVGATRLLVPAGLLLTPWLMKSWWLTGNPVYPFLYGIFGGPEWSAELGRQLGSWLSSMGMGRGGLDYLLLPWRVLVAGQPGYQHFDGRILPLWLLWIPLAMWSARGRPLVGRCLGVVGLYFVFWAASAQQMRFLIAVLPHLAVAAAVALTELTGGLPRLAARATRIATGVLLAGVLCVADEGFWSRTRAAARDYLAHGGDIKRVAVKPAYEFINRKLPLDSRLLFLNTNHGFFCRRDFVADSFFEASQINALLEECRDKQEIQEQLGRLGISHLLIENRDRYIPWPHSLYEFLRDSERVRLLYRSPDGAHDVVELVVRWPPAP